MRRASFYAKTVELAPWELPPPPKPIEKVRDALERAAVWAVDAGPELAEAITELIEKTRRAA